MIFGHLGLQVGRPGARRQWWLDVTSLSSTQEQAWREFLAAIAALLELDVRVQVFSGAPPEDGAAFAFVSSSAALSRKLLWNVPRIYVAPRASPGEVDPWLWWGLRAENAHGAIAGLLTERRHGASVISSVFRGDEFLPGFLRNCSQWQGYAQVEHFLIRPDSPGQEHAALVEYVRQWPSAIYLCLPKDPGLYAVWNLGAQLATAEFLSNANLDDRRAPAQLALLTATLRANPQMSAVAAVLRVSQTPGMDWEASGGCPTMFADLADGVYGVADLLRRNAGALVSRNFLHCMPVWRRDLHAQFGFFDEGRYGPSADWAFWLSCGAGGTRFGFVARPLGLYLRDPRSYWRRNPQAAAADVRIAQQYAWTVEGARAAKQSAFNEPRPLGLRLGQVRDLLDAGAIAEGLGLLLQSFLSNSREMQAAAGAVLDSLCKLYLDGVDLHDASAPLHALEPGAQGGALRLARLLTVLLQQHEAAGAQPSRRARWLLQWVGADLVELGHPTQGRLLWAFLHRICGDNLAEREMLRLAYHKDAAGFWRKLQSVYRFAKPLPEVMADLDFSSLSQRGDIQLRNTPLKRILYFPAYYNNSYLSLLYAPLEEAGVDIVGFRDIGKFLKQQPLPNRENVLHIHWVQELVENFATINGEKIDIIARLQQKQKQGFKLYWTIHNRLSHECRDERKELDFRKKLYAIVDRVYVHHPLAIQLLDWLPDNKKIVIHEHGPLEVPDFNSEAIARFRESLGLNNSDFVVTVMGLMRDYKGLSDLLPVLLRMLEESPRIKLVIAGRQSSQNLKDWLKKNTHPRLIVIDEYLDARRLALHMAISDVGLIPYKAILTSGSLFHWLSAGRLVVAPDMGLVPTHVVDGWNGRLYKDWQHLAQILMHLATLERSQMNYLHFNALQTGRQLQWEVIQ